MGSFRTKGRTPAWSHRALRETLPSLLPSVRMLAYVDLHTGLGPYGHGDAMSYHAGDTPEHALARQWWGETVTTARATSAAEGINRGKTGDGVMAALPAVALVGVTIEFGTWPLPEVLAALRDEYALWRYGAGAQARERIKAAFLNAFYPQADDWRERVVERGLQVLDQAVTGVADSAGTETGT